MNREELILRILEGINTFTYTPEKVNRPKLENPWKKAGMPDFKGVPVADKPTGAKARAKTEIAKLGRKAVKRFQER